MIARCLRHRAPVLWLLLPFTGGLIAGKISSTALPVSWLLGGAVVAGGLAVGHARKANIGIALVCVAMVFSGAAAYEIQRARLVEWESLPPREARITLRVERTFAPSPDGKRVSGLGCVVATETHLSDLLGQRLYFSLARKAGERTAPLPVRSEEIAVTGLLERLPRSAELNTFDGYLTASGLNFRLTRGRLSNTQREASAYALFCERTLARFGEILSRGLERHPELAGVLRAMMLGQKKELEAEQTQRFLQSGTMHLFAISGLHIAVIAVALHGLLALVGLPRVAQLVIGLVALWLYVDITGASPSAVRAFIMIALVHAAFALRLPINPVATLAAAAMFTLVLDPMELFSASFQMSYGIVAALLLLGLPLAEYWTERWALFRDLPKATWSWRHRAVDWAWRGSLSTVALGLSATLVSTVSGMLFFQLFTPGGLLANLLLIPVSSLVILGGLASLIGGLVGLSALSVLFNHAAALVLLIIDWVIVLLLKIPGMFWAVSFSSSTAGFLVLGALFAAMFYGYTREWTTRRGGFWPPFVLCALALVFAAQWS